MRSYRLVLLTAAAVLAPGALSAQVGRPRSVPPAGQPAGSYTPAARRDIAAAQQQRVAHFNAGALARLAELYTADALLLPPDAPTLRGRAAIAGHWSRHRQQGARELRLRTIELQQEGSRAMELGAYELVRGGVTERGKYMTVWKRSMRGTWEVHREMYSADGPSIAPPQVRDAG